MDKRTLHDYEKYKNVSWEDIERRLILNERKNNFHIPDNHLWAALNHYELSSLEELLTQGLKKLSEEYLEIVDGKIYVKKEQFVQWQELLTFCPPLILIAAYSFYNKIDISYIQQTALIPPYIEELEMMKEEYNGFYDLHIHLNGSTETDILWQDALNYSNEFRKMYRSALKKEQYVKEQNEQENIFNDSDHLFNLLESAKSLRYYLVHKFVKNRDDLSYPNSDKIKNQYSQYHIRGIHPRRNRNDVDLKDLNLECLMFKTFFEKLNDRTFSQENKRELSKAFHHYLLILGSLNRFVVQQIHQNGFQQFQKLTVNDFRNLSEEKYENRFFQLRGNNVNSNFKILEGRFAPKKTPVDNNQLISKIRQGWYSFKDEIKSDNVELRLVCHFIKKSISKDDSYRHEKLRTNLWKQAEAIKSLKNDNIWMQYPEEDKENYFQKLVAIDAAASEFDAPPEVFAPIFRFLRRKDIGAKDGFKNITYHVGEDFFHIASGLRAIYEAIDFLEMREGDRIGHGTALGIPPQLWRNRIGSSFYISRGEWVDNLIFIIYFLEIHTSELYGKIETEIRKHINNIYPFELLFSINDLTEAWRLRKWDPDVFFTKNVSEIYSSKEEEWYMFSKLTPSAKVTEILRFYQKHTKEYNKKILVNFDIIDDDIIILLQQKLLSEIYNKGIILETLPTSNVRIGIYKHHNEHHLKEWINEDIIANNPKVVVGCDDAGIFATNIYNEYAHIYMMYNKNQGDIIAMLMEHSNTSIFTD
ncbi:MAG: hypothetical protein LBR46_08650 [Prevotella sp.]|nr:hypothetical protein [Prevotella sp.]